MSYKFSMMTKKKKMSKRKKYKGICLCLELLTGAEGMSPIGSVIMGRILSSLSCFFFPSKYVLGNEPGPFQVLGSAINLHAQALIF